MKKYLYLASAAALAFASCSDDLSLKTETPNEAQGGVTATFAFGGDLEETRTSLGHNANGFYYQWSSNDQIGLFNCISPNYSVNGVPEVQLYGDKTNAVFTYAKTTGTSSAQFTGDSRLLTQGQYVAYYPWTRGNEIDPTTGTFEVVIPQLQNFNYIAAEAAWNEDYPTGGFSENVAPAVAFGKEVNGEIALEFNSVASYLVLPVAGVSGQNITSIKLSVSYKGEQQQIAGSYGIDMVEFLKAPDAYMLGGQGGNDPQRQGNTTAGKPTWTADPTDPYSIEVYFGKDGIALNPVTPVNVWFVVPADMHVNGSTLTLTFYTSDIAGNSTEVGTASRTLSDQFSNKFNGLMGRDQIRWIWAADSNPFYCVTTSVPTGSYVITTAAQFLEYAYLASNKINGSGNALETWNRLSNKFYSDFQNMVEWEDGTVKGLKPAAVVGNIDFSPSAIGSWIKGSLATGQRDLEDYYQLVYGYYANGNYPRPAGAIPPIGGIRETKIYGLSNATLNGLNIYSTNGEGVFVSVDNTNNYSTYVESLTFTNMDVLEYGNPNNTDRTYYFLAQVYDQNFTCSNVKIGAGSGFDVKANASNYTEALFDKIYSYDYMTPYYFYLDYPLVSGNTSDITYYAYDLRLNKVNNPSWVTMDFSKAPSYSNVANFVQVNNTWNLTEAMGARLKIQDAASGASNVNNAAVLKYKVTGKFNLTQVYSIVDSSTSYWTGTATTDPSDKATLHKGTAEYLASTVQGANGGTFPKDTYNLNLMGKYVNPWNSSTTTTNWFNSGLYCTMTVNGNVGGNGPLVISNVFINGLKNNYHPNTGMQNSDKLATGSESEDLSYEAINFMTLFGNVVTASNVTVNDIEISPVDQANDNYIIIAAFGSDAQGNNNNLKVGTLDINNKQYTNLLNSDSFRKGEMGGFFYQWTNNASGSGWTMSTMEGNPFNMVEVGYVAGNLVYNIVNNPTLNNPFGKTGYAGDFAPFGAMKFSVQGLTQSSTTFYLNNFGTTFLNANNIDDYFDNYESDMTNTDYILFLVQDGVKTAWEYNATTRAYSQITDINNN